MHLGLYYCVIGHPQPTGPRLQGCGRSASVFISNHGVVQVAKASYPIIEAAKHVAQPASGSCCWYERLCCYCQAVRLLDAKTWEPIAELAHSDSPSEKAAVLSEEVEVRQHSAAAFSSGECFGSLVSCSLQICHYG